MQRAIALGEKAASEDEVPVGAVIVKDNQLISEGWNQPIQSHDASAHAEMTAIRNHTVCYPGALLDVCRGNDSCQSKAYCIWRA